jgi:hypothetical protein
MTERQAVSYCSACDAPAVSEDGRMAMVFHAARCPERPEGQPEDRCQNVACWRVLDPVRAAHGAKSCDSRCRAAAWKQRTGYGRGDSRPAPVVAREGRSHASRSGPSGLTVSYRKAVGVVTDLLVHEAGWDAGPAEGVAEAWLRGALSEGQRARLDARP